MAVRTALLVITDSLIFCKHVGSSKCNRNFIFFFFRKSVGAKPATHL